MTDKSSPTELVERIAERVEPFIAREVEQLPSSVTGSLAELLTWWMQRVPMHGIANTTNFEMNNSLIDTASGANLELGAAMADKAIDSGATMLTLVSHNHKTSLHARAIIGLLTRRNAHAVYFQNPEISDITAMQDMEVIRDLIREHLDDRGNPLNLAQLDTVISFTVGILITASARRTPVIMGNLSHLAAALITHRLSVHSWHWWRYGSTSPDAAVQCAVERIGIPSGLPLNLSDDSGIGARISAQLLQELIFQELTENNFT